MTSPAHKLFKSVQTSDFKWDQSQVRGAPADFRSSQVPSDANSEFLAKIHRSHKRKKKTATKQQPVSNLPVSTPRVKVAPAISHHANTKLRPYRPDPSHYLQRVSTAS